MFSPQRNKQEIKTQHKILYSVLFCINIITINLIVIIKMESKKTRWHAEHMV